MKKIARSILSFLICATGSVLFAQQSPKPVEPAATVTVQQLEAQVKDLQDQVAEKDIQISNLQMSLLQSQAGQVSATKQKAIADLQSSHPGMRWDEQTGKMVPIPQPPSKPEAPKK